MFLSLKNLNEGGEAALYNCQKQGLLLEGCNPKYPCTGSSSEQGWQNLQKHYLPNRKWEKLRK